MQSHFPEVDIRDTEIEKSPENGVEWEKRIYRVRRNWRHTMLCTTDFARFSLILPYVDASCGIV